jgi:hypothetical protein
LPTEYFDIKTGGLVVALVQRDKEIGMPAVVAEIGNERDALQGLGRPVLMQNAQNKKRPDGDIARM